MSIYTQYMMSKRGRSVFRRESVNPDAFQRFDPVVVINLREAAEALSADRTPERALECLRQSIVQHQQVAVHVQHLRADAGRLPAEARRASPRSTRRPRLTGDGKRGYAGWGHVDAVEIVYEGPES